MKQFTARARAEEAIFANRSKAEFVLYSRSLRRLGEWAASKIMAAESDTATQYADALVKSRIEGNDPLKSVLEDLRSAGITEDEKSVSRRFERYVTEARKAA